METRDDLRLAFGHVERRAVFRLPVAAKVPVVGLYSSALTRAPPEPWPPAISTMPLTIIPWIMVAVWSSRAVFRLPVGVKVPVAGLYSSALAKILPFSSEPPAISTMPLFNRVAV